MGKDDFQLSTEDRLFAELVVSQNLCSREQVNECISSLQNLSQTGMSSVPSLGQLLVENGYLTRHYSPVSKR